MKLVQLNKSLLSVQNPEKWFTVAYRKRDFILPVSLTGDAAIETSFIYKHDNLYYLFVSFNYCCEGEKSAYKIMIGRSEQVNGPYVHKDGVALNMWGGSLLLMGDAKCYGVGHNALANFNGIDYLVCHAYYAADKGRSKLEIVKLDWLNGWPVVRMPRQQGQIVCRNS